MRVVLKRFVINNTDFDNLCRGYLTLMPVKVTARHVCDSSYQDDLTARSIKCAQSTDELLFFFHLAIGRE